MPRPAKEEKRKPREGDGVAGQEGGTEGGSRALYRELFERARSRDDGTAVLAPAEAVSRGRGHGGGVSAGGRRGESVGLVGERLSVGCQRASQSLRAAQAPANHLPSPPPTLRPPSALQPLYFLSFSHRLAVYARVSPLFPPFALVLSLLLHPSLSPSLRLVHPLHFPQ